MAYVIDTAGCRIEITDTQLEVRSAQGEVQIPLDAIVAVQLGATQQPPTVQVRTAAADYEWSVGDRSAEAVAVIQSSVARAAHAMHRMAVPPPPGASRPGEARQWQALGAPPVDAAIATGAPPAPSAGDGPPAPSSTFGGPALAAPDGPPGPPVPLPAAPPAPAAWAAPSAGGPAGYRSSGVRAAIAMILVGLTVGVIALLALAMAHGLAVIDEIGTAAGVADARQFEQQAASLSGVYLVLLVSSIVAFLAWLSRAVDNVPALGGGQPAFTPRASIGWWFVPIANLVQGYRIMADLWRRMAPTAAQQRAWPVAVWWLGWLGANVTTSAMSRTPLVTAEALRGYLSTLILLYAILAVVGVIFMAIIAIIERRAQERAAAFASPFLPVSAPLG